MFITADQLLAHAVGDYLLQSDWMANEKTRRSLACVAHVVTYVLPFLFLTRDLRALAFIVVTHFVIDRWRLARYVCWAKNFLAPRRPLVTDAERAVTIDIANQLRAGEGLPAAEPVSIGWPRSMMHRNWSWAQSSATGYGPDKPPWMSVWLMIIADNVLHVCANGAALYWWG